METTDTKPTTQLDGKIDGNERNPDGTFKEGNKVNPTGKGGFGDRPETINKGGRPKNDVSIMYWAKKYLEEVEEGHSKTRAQELAEKMVTMAYAQGNVVLIKELLERIEGKTPLKIEGSVGEGLLAVASKLDDIINNKDDAENNLQGPSNNPDSQAN